MRAIVIFTFLFVVAICYSQQEVSIWYFGDHAGLDFTSGTPVALTDGSIMTSEGCSTIADLDGNLLFYTNGVTVWNKEHSVMSNGVGLMGNNSATQSSVVVPNPLYNGIFYIFTVDCIENNLAGGFRYSTIDMNQNAGLGNVVSKNNLLFSSSCEKVTAVSHSNGIDYWVIAHKWQSAEFYSFPVTSFGIGTPVVSTIGMTHTGNIRNAIGYLKASPLGDRVAVAIETDGAVELFDFNDQTGSVTNCKSFYCPNYQRTYGVEFSPDGTKLYISNWDPTGRIYQFDATLQTGPDIQNSAVMIFSSSGSGIQRAALQLGPDLKIYIARRYQTSISVINEPNEPGLNCDYHDGIISLGGKTSLFGLPTFIQSKINPQQNFQFENQCYQDTTYFYVSVTAGLDSVYWDFDDPASGNANTSTEFNPYHIFSGPGLYSVELSSFFMSSTVITTKDVLIHPLPDPDLGNDTTVCGNDSILLHAGAGYITYLWQNGSNDSLLVADTTGLYWVEVTNEYGCIGYDSIFIEFGDIPDVDLGNDTVVCGSMILNAGSGYSSYLWQDGSDESFMVADTSGLYWVEVSNGYGCIGGDSIYLEIYPQPIVNLGSDTLICEGDSLILNAGSGFMTYHWCDGSVDSIMLADTSGYYWVEVSNEFGCTNKDTILISFYPFPFEDLNLGADTTFCPGAQYFLNAGSGYTYYEWQDGSHDSIFIADTCGIYWVFVSNPCGEAIDTVNLSLYPLSELNVGNDTSICHGEFVFLDAGPDFVEYLWQDGSTGSFYFANTTGTFWVQATDSNYCIVTDSIDLIFVLPDPALGNDTSMCYGNTVTFFAAEDFVNYLWNDGSVNSYFIADTSGTFWCEVTDTMGCKGTDSISVELGFAPVTYLGNDTSFCIGDAITLYVCTDPDEYEIRWQDGSSDTSYYIDKQGVYWVELENYCGKYRDSINVYVNELPKVWLGNDTTIDIEGSFVLDAGAGFQHYLWQDNSLERIYTVLDPGQYWVEVFDGYCYNSDTINIEAFPCDLNINNVFTPNGDQWNDYFFAETSEDIYSFKLTIFNRWGEKVFEANRPEEKWDGKSKGAVCSVGVYYWIVEYSCFGMQKKTILKGSVTLLR